MSGGTSSDGAGGLHYPRLKPYPPFDLEDWEMDTSSKWVDWRSSTAEIIQWSQFVQISWILEDFIRNEH